MKHDADRKLSSWARVREVSKQLFGNRYRLEIGAAVARAEPGVFYARQLAHTLNLAENVVQAELRRFLAADLLQLLDQVPGQRAVYYQRVGSPFWESCERILNDISGDQATGSA